MGTLRLKMHVLSDVMMPDLDGFGLLQAVRADHSLRDVPMILLSARAGEESRLEGLSSGADDYLVKPFSARELLSRIQSNLQMARLRKDAQKSLRESEERLRALVNASSYVVYRMSPDWKEMRQLDGQGFITDTQAPDTNWIDRYIHPDDRPRVLQTIQDAIASKTIFELEHRVIRPDGSLGWTLSRAVPVLNEDGEITEWFGAASDVTKRKETEENYRKLAESLDAEVRARTRELEDQSLHVLRQSEQVRDLSWRLLRTQEEERRHIARELHDSAGQTLTILGMNLVQLIRKAGGDNSPFGEEIRRSEEIVNQLQKEIRTTSYLLHPPLLDETGLPSALSWYVQGLKERSGLDLTLNISQEFGRLPRDMELVIFRLVQECLTNIHRHSESKTATITVTRDVHSIHVEVTDQGKGISPERLAEISAGGSGVGIRGMRERLLQYGGSISITSNKTGTQISVIIPAPKETTNIGIDMPDSIGNSRIG